LLKERHISKGQFDNSKLKPMNALWRLTSLVLLCLIAKTSSAQLHTGKYELGLGGGVFVYQGDLTPSALGSYRTLAPAVNLFVNRMVNRKFSVRGSLFYGGLRGDDAAYSSPEWRQQRALRFNARNIELSAMLLYHPLGTDRRLFTYLFGGAGLAFTRITRDWSRFNSDYFLHENLGQLLNEDLARTPPKVLPVIPVGAGIRYAIIPRLSAFAETSYRLTRTDYLDGFSKVANPDMTDHYQSYTVGLIWSFGRRSMLDCPAIVQ
jgi:hypothetical protein